MKYTWLLAIQYAHYFKQQRLQYESFIKIERFGIFPSSAIKLKRQYKISAKHIFSENNQIVKKLKSIYMDKV